MWRFQNKVRDLFDIIHYMGKLEELKMNVFHLGDTRIYIPGQFGQWCRTKPIDVKSWYKVVNNTYLEVDEDVRESGK